MKNLKSFDSFQEDNLDEGLRDLFKKKFSPEKFKTVIAYYHKMNNTKNVKYWLKSLVNTPIEKVIDSLDTQYNKLKPKFVGLPGGGTDTNEGHEDLIKKIKSKPTVYDSLIIDDINAFIPDKKDDAFKILNISVKPKTNVQAKVQESVYVKKFHDFI
jgi:hypothetical protein